MSSNAKHSSGGQYPTLTVVITAGRMGIGVGNETNFYIHTHTVLKVMCGNFVGSSSRVFVFSRFHHVFVFEFLSFCVFATFFRGKI